MTFIGFERKRYFFIFTDNKYKIIRVKDLQIFENTSIKTFSALSHFDRKLIFYIIQILNEQKSFNENSISKNKTAKPRPHQKSKET